MNISNTKSHTCARAGGVNKESVQATKKLNENTGHAFS